MSGGGSDVARMRCRDIEGSLDSESVSEGEELCEECITVCDPSSGGVGVGGLEPEKMQLNV